ncbi:MAG: glycosyltransferase [Candidatus Aminicenantes bacterium]|nr:MAG: glycosyltransferase [Candidatus Aminicenantes bacterium]
MKICTISFHCCPFSLLGGDGTGGMNVYLRELSSALSDYPEMKIDIFTRVQNPKIREVRHFSPQVRVVHLKGGPERPVDRTQLYGSLPEFYENLESFIFRERENYDLIYTHYWLSGLVGERLKEKFNLPLVHIYHTLAFLKKVVLENNGTEHKCRIKAEQHLARVSDAIISSSEQEMRNLIDEYGIPFSKVRVIYPGVNGKIFYPFESCDIYQEMQYREDDRVLLFVGRIDPVKGLMTVIDALELLKRREFPLYDKMKLIVIGGGRKTIDLPRSDEFVRIKRAIEEKNLRGKVQFLGSKKQDELGKYYSAADALVFPSLYESFGLVALEALACGTPVIASRIGELTSIIKEGENGLSFSPDDPSSLSIALERFFLNKSSLWPKGRIHQNVANNFSWDKTATETYGLFKKIIRKKAFLTTIFPPCESPLLV